MQEKEQKEREEQEKGEKVKQFKEVAAKQRNKIKDLKRDELLKQNDISYEEQAVASRGQQDKLTEENLQKHEVVSEAAAAKKKS